MVTGLLKDTTFRCCAACGDFDQGDKFDLAFLQMWVKLPEVWMRNSLQSLVAICFCLSRRAEIWDWRDSSVGSFQEMFNISDRLFCCGWMNFWSWLNFSESELVSLDICKTVRHNETSACVLPLSQGCQVDSRVWFPGYWGFFSPSSDFPSSSFLFSLPPSFLSFFSSLFLLPSLSLFLLFLLSSTFFVEGTRYFCSLSTALSSLSFTLDRVCQ